MSREGVCSVMVVLPSCLHNLICHLVCKFQISTNSHIAGITAHPSIVHLVREYFQPSHLYSGSIPS